MIFLLRRLAPNWPGMLIAVTLASVVALAVRFAGRDHRQPFRPIARWLAVAAAAVDILSAVLEVLPAALSFTLLGAVESLLRPRSPTA